MRRPVARTALACGAALLASACVFGPSPTPVATTPPTLEPTASPTPASTSTASGDAEPTPSPEPTLGLDLPDERDDRVVVVEVAPNVGSEGGEIVVSVTNQSDDRIGELVLRWPRELNRALFLRPFVPSEDRIRDGGPPLVQTWTKWVLGPGEEGEPEGTVSLGYGPMPGGATFNIGINVVRRADGPVEFDLQVLSENALLSLPDGSPAELRIEIP